MPKILPIKENLSNLLKLASDGNCSLLLEEINQHLASLQVLKLIPDVGLSRVNVYPEACSVCVENGYENDSSFTQSTWLTHDQ